MYLFGDLELPGQHRQRLHPLRRLRQGAAMFTMIHALFTGRRIRPTANNFTRKINQEQVFVAFRGFDNAGPMRRTGAESRLEFAPGVNIGDDIEDRGEIHACQDLGQRSTSGLKLRRR